MARIYIPLVREDQVQPQFIVVDNCILERHRVDVIKFVAWDDNAVPTMTEWHLGKWCESERGDWCCNHGHNLVHLLSHKFSSNETLIAIHAYFPPKRWTEFCLKFLDNPTH